jgi:hypothetical protein
VDESLLMMIYGAYGIGKTADTIYAAPESKFIAEPMAVRTVARSVCGIEIPDDRIERPAGIDALIAVAKKPGPWASIVIDDFSLIAQEEFMRMQQGGLDGFKLFGAFKDKMLTFRHEARRASRTIIVSAHDGAPHRSELSMRTILGGPKLLGQAQEEILGVFDSAYRVLRGNRPVGFLSEYHAGDDPTYGTKDRLNVVVGAVPANLSEVLRARNYVLPRHPKLTWLDEAIHRYAESLTEFVSKHQVGLRVLFDRATMGSLFAQVRADATQRYTKLAEHQNWLLRDVYDRVIIRALIASRMTGAQSLFGG